MQDAPQIQNALDNAMSSLVSQIEFTTKGQQDISWINQFLIVLEVRFPFIIIVRASWLFYQCSTQDCWTQTCSAQFIHYAKVSATLGKT